MMNINKSDLVILILILLSALAVSLAGNTALMLIIAGAVGAAINVGLSALRSAETSRAIENARLMTNPRGNNNNANGKGGNANAEK